MEYCRGASGVEAKPSIHLEEFCLVSHKSHCELLVRMALTRSCRDGEGGCEGRCGQWREGGRGVERWGVDTQVGG